MRRSSASGKSHDTHALLLRRVEFGEADLIVTLLTQSLGRVSAIARQARRSSRRFGGALEPFYTLRVRLRERPAAELLTLEEASIVRPRLGLLRELARLEAAGRALAWLRAAAPARTPEPAAWDIVENLLDRLAEGDAERGAELELASSGLGLLGALGWGIDFEHCVRCGKPCPEGMPASVDPTRGGLVCRNCGGGRTRLEAPQRERLARAAAGHAQALLAADAPLALELIERTLRAHAGIEPAGS